MALRRSGLASVEKDGASSQDAPQMALRRSGLTKFGKFLNCRPNMASTWNLKKLNIEPYELQNGAQMRSKMGSKWLPGGLRAASGRPLGGFWLPKPVLERFWALCWTPFGLQNRLKMEPKCFENSSTITGGHSWPSGSLLGQVLG